MSALSLSICRKIIYFSHCFFRSQNESLITFSYSFYLKALTFPVFALRTLKALNIIYFRNSILAT